VITLGGHNGLIRDHTANVAMATDSEFSIIPQKDTVQIMKETLAQTQKFIHVSLASADLLELLISPDDTLLL